MAQYEKLTNPLVMYGMAALALCAMLILITMAERPQTPPAVQEPKRDRTEAVADDAASRTTAPQPSAQNARYAPETFPAAWQVYEQASLSVRFMHPAALAVTPRSTHDASTAELVLRKRGAPEEAPPVAVLSFAPLVDAAGTYKANETASRAFIEYVSRTAASHGRAPEEVASEAFSHTTYAWFRSRRASSTHYLRRFNERRVAHLSTDDARVAQSQWFAVVRSSLAPVRDRYATTTWKTYTDQQLGFALSYPPHWQAFYTAPRECPHRADPCRSDVYLTPDPGQPALMQTPDGARRVRQVRIVYGTSPPIAPDEESAADLASLQARIGGKLGMHNGLPVLHVLGLGHPQHQDFFLHEESFRFTHIQGLDTPLFDEILGTLRSHARN